MTLSFRGKLRAGIPAQESSGTPSYESALTTFYREQPSRITDLAYQDITLAVLFRREPSADEMRTEPDLIARVPYILNLTDRLVNDRLLEPILSHWSVQPVRY